MLTMDPNITIDVGAMVNALSGITKTQIKDLSKYLLGVIPSNITFVNDRNGNSFNAAYFNGTSHITVMNDSVLQLTNEFTISVWLKPDTGYGLPSTVGYVYFVGRWKNTGLKASTWNLSYNVQTNSVMGSTHDGNVNSLCPSSNTLPENHWTHIAFIFQSGKAYIYINGELSNSVPAVTPQYSDYNLEIGWQNDNRCLYIGGMDELMIFNRALTESEILQLSK